MQVDQMRAEIIRPYKNDMWKAKVSCMSDEQVTAIYLRFVRDGKLQQNRYTIDIGPAKLNYPRGKDPVKPIQCATTYHCEWCGAEYMRDNPDLDACEECGQAWD